MYLDWLPKLDTWKQELQAARALPPAEALPQLTRLANHSIDFVETARLDRAAEELRAQGVTSVGRTPPVKLAFLGSSTLGYLTPGIRAGALRRGFYIDVFEGAYAMYHQLLADETSELYAYRPDIVLLALDAHHLTAGEGASAERALDQLRACWRLAKDRLGATVIQQTVLPIFQPILGSNEHRYGSSRHSIVHTLNEQMRRAADEDGVHLLALDTLSQRQGVVNWYEPALWHRAKQEVHPRLSPLYGDHVARLVASIRGLSFKCMVLDLDNTLWGGVIGDDGLSGIYLGQGHALGEAFSSFQNHVKSMAARGVILAVSSKNDHENALAPFQSHPEMVLRTADIASFFANWDDKATNIRKVAQQLNIGLDALVFIDDNPFERNLIRRELPMLAVPELPEDPALYEDTIAAAGYFEATTLTSEDLSRPDLYRANATRAQALQQSTDMGSYLQSLQMQLYWSPFDEIGLPRIVQLINKSNQFNLTTKRYTTEGIARVMDDATSITLQLRLTDIYGDNGVIGIIIATQEEPDIYAVDTWLMSCRVLGRQVEQATLNLLVAQVQQKGARLLRGTYLPTEKNGMVKDHYGRLGFNRVSQEGEAASTWVLSVEDYVPKETFISPVEVKSAMEESNDARANLLTAD